MKIFVQTLLYFSFVLCSFALIHSASAQTQDANSFYGNNNLNNSSNSNFNQNSSYGSTGFNSSNFQSNTQQNSRSSSRRSSSRRSSRTSQNESLNGIGTTAPNSSRRSDRTAPQGISPSGGGAPGTSSSLSVLGGGDGGANTPSKQAKPRMVNVKPVNVLYLVAKSSVLKVNEPFSVDVKLSMPEAGEFDSLAFKLSYNPNVLLPVQGRLEDGEWAPANALQYIMPETEPAQGSSIDRPNVLFADSSESALIQANEINHQLGEVTFKTSKHGLAKNGSYFVASLMFVPLRPVENSSIRFEFEPIKETHLSTHLVKDGQDWLGSSENAMDGVVPLHFEVQDPNQDLVRSNVITSSLDAPSIDESGKLPARLVLQVDDKNIQTDDVFNLVVSLSNPDQRNIDEVNVFLLYNPNVMQAIDGRSAASPRQKIDGMLPLDFTTHQEINSEKGIIDIRKRTSRSAVRDSGVCFVIPFRALKPTKKTTFRVLIDGSGKAPTTGAFYKGRDALGDLLEPQDGCLTTSLTIRPTTAYLEKNVNR